MSTWSSPHNSWYQQISNGCVALPTMGVSNEVVGTDSGPLGRGVQATIILPIVVES